jgi:hypothetical protein
MRVAGTSADGPVTHFGIYWVGPGKALQFIVSTTPDALPGVEQDIRALLEGFSITVEKRVPQERRAFTVSFPPQKWRIKDDGTRDGVMLFEHSRGDVIGMASAQRVDVPKDGLRAFVLDQAKAIAPRVRVVSEASKDLEGAKVSVLHMEGTTTDGVNAVFLGYFFSGSGAYVQAFTVVARERFAERREDMTEFLDGLQIHLPRE